MRPVPEEFTSTNQTPIRNRLYTSVKSTTLRRNDKVALYASMAAGVIIIILLAGILHQLVTLSMPAMRQFGLGFLTAREWNPVTQEFGALPFIYGTLGSSAIALLIATPFGVGTALFLTEMAPKRMRSATAFIVDMLAAIPSVVYGLWGIFVLAPFVQGSLAPFLETYLGFIPLFRGPNVGVSMLTAGLILAIMVVPYITAIAREVLMTTPSDLKAASLALGATKWETIWKVVLPYSRVGIGAGIVLALGRALGETMAVTMVIGNSPVISASILHPADSMASVIANNFREADTSLYLSALVAIGLVLFIVALVINLAARLLLWKLQGAHRDK